MELILILNHNHLVQDGDEVIHCGDFAFSQQTVDRVVPQLRGRHTFLRGSHDKWLKQHALWLWERTIEHIHVVACHYPMRSWPRSYHGSIQAHGHTHGRLKPLHNQWDVGVDHNSFYPVPWGDLVAFAHGVADSTAE